MTTAKFSRTFPIFIPLSIPIFFFFLFHNNRKHTWNVSFSVTKWKKKKKKNKTTELVFKARSNSTSPTPLPHKREFTRRILRMDDDRTCKTSGFINIFSIWRVSDIFFFFFCGYKFPPAASLTLSVFFFLPSSSSKVCFQLSIVGDRQFCSSSIEDSASTLAFCILFPFNSDNPIFTVRNT